MNKAKNSKRTLKENLAMIVRGYKIVFKIYPKYIVWRIIGDVIDTAAPYFSVLMTSLIINELVTLFNYNHVALGAFECRSDHLNELLSLAGTLNAY